MTQSAPSLLDCARLAARVYQPLVGNGWSRVVGRDGVWTWAIAPFGARRIAVIRGSTSGEDWFEDLRSEWAVEDGRLGQLPQGFAFGLDEALQAIGSVDVVVGHSLGAARACLLAGLLTYHGQAPKGLVAFGCPRPGTARLSALLSKVPAKAIFRNRDDPVTEVPVTIPEIAPWEHPVALTQLDVEPTPGTEPGLLADHRVELYVEGVAALPKAKDPLW